MSDGGGIGGAGGDGGDNVIRFKLELDGNALGPEGAQAAASLKQAIEKSFGQVDLAKAVKFSGIVGAAGEAKAAIEGVGAAGKKAGEEHAAAAERAALSVGALTGTVRALLTALSTGSFRDAKEGVLGVGEAALVASQNVGFLSAAIKTVGADVAAVGSGLAAAVGIEFEKIKQAKEAAEIAKSDRNTAVLSGQSVETFEALRKVLSDAGVDVEGLNRVFVRLAQTVSETSVSIVKDMKDEALQAQDTAQAVVDADRKVTDSRRHVADARDAEVDANRALVDAKRDRLDAVENAREATARAAVEGAHAGEEQALQAQQLEQLGPAGAALNAEEAAIRLKRYQITHDAFGNRRQNPLAGFELKQLKQEEEQLQGQSLQLQYAGALNALGEANLKAQESREYRGAGLSPTGGPGPGALGEKLGREADRAAESIDKLSEAINGKLLRAIEAAAENIAKAQDDVARAERDRARAQEAKDQERFDTIRGARSLIEGGGSPSDIAQIPEGKLRSAIVAGAMDRFGGGSLGTLQEIGDFIRNNVEPGDVGAASPAGIQAQRMMSQFFGPRFLQQQNVPAMFDALRELNPQNLTAAGQTPQVQQFLAAMRTGKEPLEAVEKQSIAQSEDDRLRALQRGAQVAPDALAGMKAIQGGENAFGTAVNKTIDGLNKLETALADAALRITGLVPSNGNDLAPLPGSLRAKGIGGAPEDAGATSAHSRGGMIHGPGTSTSDSIAARLSDGEYVVSAPAVRTVGRPFLDMINRGFAKGGPVTLSGTPRGVPSPAGFSPRLAAATAALRAAALEGGPGVIRALGMVGAAAVDPIDLSHIAGGLLTYTRDERAGALWSEVGPALTEGFGAAAGIPSPAGAHSLDLRTAGGSFSVWATGDTIEAIRTSAIGDQLTSTGSRPSWYS